MLVEDRVDARGAGGLLGAGARGQPLHARADAHDPARAPLELGPAPEALGVEPRAAGVARAEERLDLAVVGVALADHVAERAQQVGGATPRPRGRPPSAWRAASAWSRRRCAAAAARPRAACGVARRRRRRARRAGSAASATRARHRAEAAQAEPVVVVGRERDAAALGLDAEQPARGRRDADRAAAVGAQRAGDHAGGHRRGAAAARPARAALRVPRVARRAPRLRLGELRPQAPARACSSCPRRSRPRRAGGARPRSRPRPARSTTPVPCVVSSPATSMLSLTAIGTPSSGAASPRAQAGLRGVGLGQRALGAHDAEGVDRRVQARDALEAELDELARA